MNGLPPQPMIGVGQVFHRRLQPVDHAFAYTVALLMLPLRTLAHQPAPALRRNCLGLMSFHDADHGDGEADALAWIDALLKRAGITDADGEAWLQCFPRLLGHAFKPVSFWYCHRRDGSLAAVVAEVNNTFGQRQAYLLREPTLDGREQTLRKTLHVSPFCPPKGRYRFRFLWSLPRWSVQVDFDDESGRPTLHTALTGALQPLTPAAVRRVFWRMPWMTLALVLRIHWQALRLWCKHVPWFERPPAGATSPAPPPAAARALLRLLQQLPHGRLDLQAADGTALSFGHAVPQAPRAVARVHDWAVCSAVLRSGDIGFAEAYIDGHWESPDLPALLRLLLANRDAIDRLLYGHWWGRLAYRLRHLRNRNSRSGSRRNIEAHYDLGNEFYALWLDAGMTYSGALFEGDAARPLEAAQRAKLQRALRQCGVDAGQRVLELGCGWGSLAELAAGAFGAQVTGLTLSPRQLQWAQARLQRAGLSARVQLRLQDYRELDEPPFDTVVSLEMFEALGEAWWPRWFAVLARHLRHGGLACVQTIVIDDTLFERYRRSTDFIQQYVFPGGLLPSAERFRAAAQAAGFDIEDTFRFGADYAHTLRLWRQRFHGALAQVHGLGFDARFVRLWDFYLAYCEAAFDSGSTDVVQFTLRRR